MSHFDSIDIAGKGFIVSTETSSGYSGSDREDLEKLAFWRKMTEPTMKKVFKAIEKELAAMANGPDAPRLIKNLPSSTTEELETVWEEELDSMDVPSHMEKGNGPCIYRMRIRPRTIMQIDVQLFVESIPSAEARARWKDALQKAIERDVRPGDTVHMP